MTEKEKVVTVVVDDVSPASSSTATTTTTVVTADKEEAITKLLEICEASNIDVDDKIRHALLSSSSSGNRDTNRSTINRNRNSNIEQTTIKAKRMSTMADNARRTFRTRETILGALVRRRKLEQRNESSPEADIIREIGQTLGVAGKRSHPFEVRIKDGSYSVKLPSVEGEKCGNQQQQQFIPTVTNSRTLMKMARAIWGLVTSGRYQRSTDETKSVLEGINLYLEGGKTYLVLGAPGSGKSTCE